MIPRDPSPFEHEEMPGWLWSAVILAAVALSGFIFATLMCGADLPPVPRGRP